MRQAFALFVSFAMVSALAACTTTGSPQPGMDKASPKLAARYNTELATAYMNEGRMDLARSKLADALKQAPRSADVHNALALYYQRLGQYDKAEQQYRLSLQYHPDDPNTLNNYGVFLCFRGKPRDSLAYFTKAAANLNYSTPDSALANAGNCALKIPDRKLAAQYFQNTLAINPDQAQALWQLGLMSFQDGNYSDANAHLSRLVATTPKPSATVLWTAIETVWAMGRRDMAERYGRELLKLHPDSPEANKFIHLLGGAP
ncbi:MAG: type IV pilus biogenesis/stability protein PilW [Gammaproteobacteria bacterium]